MTRTRSPRRSRRLARAGLLAATIATATPAAVPVAPADAADFNVYSCRTPAGVTAPTDGWGTVELQFTNRAANECANTPTAGNLGLDLTEDSGYNMRATNKTLLRYGAASGLSFSRVTFWRTMLLDHNSYENANLHWATWIGNGSAEYTNPKMIEKCGWGCTRALPTGGHTNEVKDANKLVSPPLENSTEIFLAAGCIGSSSSQICSGDGSFFDGPQGSGTVRGGRAELQVQAVDAQITDPSAPTANDLTGSLTATGAMTGVRDLTFKAADTGSGLYHTTVEYRPAAGGAWTQTSKEIVDANGGKCAELDYRADTDNEFGTQVPCKLSVAAETASFDTTKVADGGYDVRVQLEDAAGNLGTVLEKRITVDNVPPPANTAAPGITGTAKVGQTLTATNGTWTGADITYSYQWLRCTGPDECAPIENATAATYKVFDGDIGKQLRVKVTATNVEGATDALSAATAAIPEPLSNTAAPGVTGTAKVGQTLTSTLGTWTGAGNTYARQWQRCTGAAPNVTCVNIDGATGETYKLVPADAAAAIRVIVTATNGPDSQTVASAAVGPVAETLANTTAPTITGTAKEGETLTATNGTWIGADITYSYQWQRCAVGTDGVCDNIAGATDAKYKLTGDDVGKLIKVVVTGTSADGTASATSKPTAAVTKGGSETGGGNPPGAGNPGGSTPGCTTCDPAPAPNPPGGIDPNAPNGVGGDPSSGRFTSESRRTIKTRYGKKRTLTGRLLDASGKPIANATVEVLVGKKRVATVLTDSQGNYQWALPKGVSRTVTFAYLATLGAANYRDTAVVKVKVGAVLRVKAKRATVGLREKLVIAGALLGAKKGAQIQVQAQDGPKWRTVGVIATKKNGKIVYGYRFKRADAATFVFRFKFGNQPQTRLGATVSKPIKIRVR